MRTCQTCMVNTQKQYKNDLKNPLVIFHVAMENRWKIHHDSVGKPSIDGRWSCGILWYRSPFHICPSMDVLWCVQIISCYHCKSYPLINQHNYGKSPCLMGKSTVNGHFRYLVFFVPIHPVAFHPPLVWSSPHCPPALQRKARNLRWFWWLDHRSLGTPPGVRKPGESQKSSPWLGNCRIFLAVSIALDERCKASILGALSGSISWNPIPHLIIRRKDITSPCRLIIPLIPVMGLSEIERNYQPLLIWWSLFFNIYIYVYNMINML